jgi:pSer/pThr/pTyr-binding forkhead associated (FHA) protein
MRYPKFTKSKDKLEELKTNIFDESKAYEQMYGRKGESDVSSQYIEEDIDTPKIENQIRFPLQGEKYQKAVLIQKSGPSPGKQFTIFGSETILGKSETADFVIWDNSMSNTHAKIVNLQDHFILYDLLSDSGVFLNGKKLLRPKVLYDFDEIKMGKTLLIFRGK